MERTRTEAAKGGMWRLAIKMKLGVLAKPCGILALDSSALSVAIRRLRHLDNESGCEAANWSRIELFVLQPNVCDKL